jgi:hypothetical protein
MLSRHNQFSFARSESVVVNPDIPIFGNYFRLGGDPTASLCVARHKNGMTVVECPHG